MFSFTLCFLAHPVGHVAATRLWRFQEASFFVVCLVLSTNGTHWDLPKAS